MYTTNFLPMPFSFGLYVIVDNLTWIKRLLEMNIQTIQLRIKNKSINEIEDIIAQAAELNRIYKIRLFINDYWKLAIRYNCYGLHLGQDDLKLVDLNLIRKAGLRLGISTYNSRDIDLALKVSPSYISLSHIFHTQTKQITSSPQGLNQLKRHVKRLLNYPTVAVGGINFERAKKVLATGAKNIAVSSSITNAKDWKKNIKQLMKLVSISNN